MPRPQSPQGVATLPKTDLPDQPAGTELFKRKGPGYKTDAVWWARVGEGAISAGCVVAAVAGQAYLGLPCVVGGALSTGTVHYLGTMD